MKAFVHPRLLLFSSIAVLITAFNFKHQPDPPRGYNSNYLDKSTDPCSDFYQYAIGGWIKNNPMPATESRWGSFNILNKQNEEKIKSILDGLVWRKIKFPKGSTEQLVRDLYVSAMDTITMEKAGLPVLKEELAAIDALKNKSEIPAFLGKNRRKGLYNLFSFYVGIDAKNSERHIVYVGQGGIGLPDVDYYTKQDEESKRIRTAYTEHIQRMFELAGVKGESAQVLELETKLAQISMTRTERRDPDKTYNKMSYVDFRKGHPYLDWYTYFTNAGLPLFSEMVVSQPGFFKGLEEITIVYPIETWKTYFRWQLINNLSDVTNAALEKEHFRFYSTTLRGTAQMKARWERAVSLVSGTLGEPLGQLYVKEHFSPESKQRVIEMVENLRAAFKTRIENLEWMSAETKNKALEKLNAFTYKIGYPDKWKDYSMVDIQEDQLAQNVLRVAERNYQIMIDKLNKPVDKTEWNMTPQTVNAYYNASRNEIVFPAGILQPPFFDPLADDALNYGGIGAVIGHEFSHGFDDKGSKYDAVGNLNNWWTTEDRTRFEAKTKKIIEQFNHFEVLDSVFINGSLTQGENIADFAGLTLSYYALKAKYEKNPPKVVANDGFTWQQRFFLGYSLVWAQNITDKELRNRIITDPHSPGKYRVLGPLSNMPEFWDAFGCKDNQQMKSSEERRVKIW